MLRVRFVRDTGNKLKGFYLSGHADYGPKGQDIVCAGVSALAQGALLGLEEVIGAKLKKKSKPGRLECLVSGDYTDERVQVILETLYLVIKDLQSGYKEYIHLAEERR